MMKWFVFTRMSVWWFELIVFEFGTKWKNTVTKIQQIFPSILQSNQLSSVDNDFRIYKNTPPIYIHTVVSWD